MSSPSRSACCAIRSSSGSSPTTLCAPKPKTTSCPVTALPFAGLTIKDREFVARIILVRITNCNGAESACRGPAPCGRRAPFVQFQKDHGNLVVQHHVPEKFGQGRAGGSGQAGRQLLDPPAGFGVELRCEPAALRREGDPHRPGILRVGFAPDQAVALGAV